VVTLKGLRVGTLMQRGVQSGHSGRCSRVVVQSGCSEWGFRTWVQSINFMLQSYVTEYGIRVGVPGRGGIGHIM
jgi:hypothetical protein